MMVHGHLSWEATLMLIVILLLQGGWLFFDARRHSRYPWLWGVWGLLQCPVPTIVYLIAVRNIWRRWR